MKQIALTVNGRRVEALVEPRTHLGDFLRDQQRLTGTHLGCEHGVCGACTVLIGGEPARACIVYAIACDGLDVRTIEGLDDDPVTNQLRAAFSAEHGLQCGFCTPGMVIAARDICLRLPDADERRIRVELSGNLCRCTGYVGIVNAVKRVIAERGGGVTAADKPAQMPRPAIQAFVPAAASEAGPAVASSPASAAAVPAAQVPAPAGMTQIKESFTIPHPPARVWQTLGDLPLAASCLPGAEITEHDDRSAKGRIKIKFGPMSAAFSGAAGFERDDAAMTATVRGGGTDSLSNTRARGDLNYKVTPEQGGAAARVEVTVGYSLVGPLAQFSRSGLVKDFASRLAAEFARNLNQRIAQPQAAPMAARELGAASLLFSVLWGRIRRWIGRARD